MLRCKFSRDRSYFASPAPYHYPQITVSRVGAHWGLRVTMNVSIEGSGVLVEHPDMVASAAVRVIDLTIVAP